jgi:Protein of unknown function (DUF3347)
MKKQILTVGTVILFAVGSTTFIGCGNSENQESKNHEHAEGEGHAEGGHDNSDGHSHGESESDGAEDNTAEYEGEKVKDLSLILDSYFELVDALVNDDEKLASEAAGKVLVAFKGFDGSSIGGDQASEYAEIEESAVENAQHIAKSEIFHQREHLAILSEDINDLITIVGSDQKLYLDFCPMAEGGDGATWVSKTEEIQNPYMGSKMPTCGKIQQEL